MDDSIDQGSTVEETARSGASDTTASNGGTTTAPVLPVSLGGTTVDLGFSRNWVAVILLV